MPTHELDSKYLGDFNFEEEGIDRPNDQSNHQITPITSARFQVKEAVIFDAVHLVDPLPFDRYAVSKSTSLAWI